MTRRKSKKAAILILVLILLIAGIASYFLLRNSEQDLTSVTDEDGIIYAPATDEEKTETERHKDSLADEQDQSNPEPDNGTKKQVSPVITSWGQASSGADFTINGYVPEITESDGTCKLVMKKNGTEVTQDKIAFFNAQSTSCGQIIIPFNRLSQGSWQTMLTYNSSKSQGNSEPVTVEVK